MEGSCEVAPNSFMSMATTTEDQSALGANSQFLTRLPPLAGVLTGTNIGVLGDLGTYRKYVGALHTRASFQHNADTSIKSILYEIGKRSESTKEMLKVSDDDGVRVAQTVRTGSVVSVELSALHKKYTNFSGNFEFMDLSAVAYQCARALAVYSVHGGISCAQMRAGMPMMVRALAVRDDPVGASEGAIFIPRQAALDATPGAFAALVAASNAMGSIVYTDVVTVDGNNAPVITEPHDAELALGCAGALRILMSMYDAAGAGCVCAYAIVKGIHSVTSVVGHTDEGAYFRSVIRLGGFKAPYGGIYAELAMGYVAIPMPSATMPQTFTCLVDTIALKSAALVALSDPMVVVKGRSYPTTFTVIEGRTYEAGLTNAGGASDAAFLSRKIAGDCNGVAAKFVELCGWLFATQGGVSVAQSALTCSFGMAVGRDDRHLRFKSVAPYYWIEPTSLFAEIPQTSSQSNGYGVLAPIGSEIASPTFEEKTVVFEDRALQAIAGISWRSARTNPLIVHLSQHHLDGLAAIVPLQYVAENVHMVGGSTAVSARRANGTGLDGYMWGRGQCGLPAPSEFMYLGEKLGVRLAMKGLDDFGTISLNHLPELSELVDGVVHMKAHPPAAYNRGKLGEYTRAVARERSIAANALESARVVMGTQFYTGGETWVPTNTEPGMRGDPDAMTTCNLSITRGEVDLGRGPSTTKGGTVEFIKHDATLKPTPPRQTTGGTGGAAPQRHEEPEKPQLLTSEQGEAPPLGAESTLPQPPAA